MKIDSHGKKVTAYYICNLCKCEFHTNGRESKFIFDHWLMQEDGNLKGVYEGTTDCPECGFECKTTDVLIEDRTSEEAAKLAEEDARLEALRSAVNVKGAVLPGLPKTEFDKICPKW